MDGATSLFSLLPLLIIQGVFAIVVGLVAKKIGLMTWLWVVLTLIPGLGLIIVPWFVAYKVVAAVIDRLDQISEKLDTTV